MCLAPSFFQHCINCGSVLKNAGDVGPGPGSTPLTTPLTPSGAPAEPPHGIPTTTHEFECVVCGWHVDSMKFCFRCGHPLKRGALFTGVRHDGAPTAPMFTTNSSSAGEKSYETILRQQQAAGPPQTGGAASGNGASWGADTTETPTSSLPIGRLLMSSSNPPSSGSAASSRVGSKGPPTPLGVGGNSRMEGSSSIAQSRNDHPPSGRSSVGPDTPLSNNNNCAVRGLESSVDEDPLRIGPRRISHASSSDAATPTSVQSEPLFASGLFSDYNRGRRPSGASSPGAFGDVGPTSGSEEVLLGGSASSDEDVARDPRASFHLPARHAGPALREHLGGKQAGDRRLDPLPRRGERGGETPVRREGGEKLQSGRSGERGDPGRGGPNSSPVEALSELPLSDGSPPSIAQLPTNFSHSSSTHGDQNHRREEEGTGPRAVSKGSIRGSETGSIDSSLEKSASWEPPRGGATSSQPLSSSQKLQRGGPTVLIAGHLFKIGKLFHQKKKRYYVLQDRFLYYYLTESSPVPKGVIFLDGAIVSKRPTKAKAVPSANSKTCENPDESLESWDRDSVVSSPEPQRSRGISGLLKSHTTPRTVSIPATALSSTSKTSSVGGGTFTSKNSHLPALEIRLSSGKLKTLLCPSELDCERWLNALTRAANTKTDFSQKYELLEEIGKGRFATVRRARKRGTRVAGGTRSGTSGEYAVKIYVR